MDTTNSSDQTAGQTAQASDGDLKALQDLQTSLEEEQVETDKVYADAGKEIDAATASDMATVNDSLTQLDTLEQQADEEEKQGQIKTAQDQVQQS